MDSIHFYVMTNEIGQRRNTEKFKTTTGYKAEVAWNKNDEPFQLIVKAPEYRSDLLLNRPNAMSVASSGIVEIGNRAQHIKRSEKCA